ncbi:CYTH domain-containing protein [Loigolactobacillus binensis]|uniref:CYTH domain-containing protein n=1 Tax=Loigolactobacillus binensis TaxID=2559922 RepID=A0ABW3EAE6_9LACO|nr:CYTH domain-containing protein [Loigolactobacillus binensis]
MSRQKEHEFKNLLTMQEYQQLLQTYSFSAPFRQTNLYFDTATQQLRRLGCGLRIRLFKDHAEQTLKIPASSDHTLWEITDAVPLALAQQQLKIQQPSQISRQLQQYHITVAQLQLIGYAQTLRRQVELSSGLLVLDQTNYADGTQDYEIELEVQAPTTTLTDFSTWLRTQQIAQRPVKNKVARAVQHYVAGEKQYENLVHMLFN